MTGSTKSGVHGPALVLGVCLALVLGAWGFEHIGGLAPCELCYWQRYALYAAIPLAMVALILSRAAPDGTMPRFVAALAAVAVLVGAGIAFYHSGVEFGWWPGPDTCSVTALDDPRAALLNPDNVAVVRCDEVPWSLFGVSMAGYNFLISGATGLIALWLALKGRATA
ncbi:MAG: disulfide bond formation protein B [Alphaproteobacteria bacterium]